MNLRQRLDEIRQLEQKADKGKWEGADYWVNSDFIDAMRNAIGPLMEVVEQQHRALSNLIVMLPSADNDAPDTDRIPAAFNYVRWLDIREARAALAALAALDKEEA